MTRNQPAVKPPVALGGLPQASSQLTLESERQLVELESLSPDLLVAGRYERFRRLGRIDVGE